MQNIETRGGSSKYVSIELQSEKMDQYNLTMQDVASAISDANVASPSGEADAGNLELSVTTSLKTEQVNELQDIPIKTPAGQIISLSDVANVYEATKDRGGISRYNGQGDDLRFDSEAAGQHRYGSVLGCKRES